MTPKQLLAAAFRAHLSLDRFGERVTYVPAGGGPEVAIIAQVRQSLQSADDQTEARRRDVLVVSFASDPAAVDAAGNALGGVVEPQTGDALYRSGLGDPADKLYGFEGNVLERSDHHWRVEFARIEQQQVGMMGGR